MRPESNRSHFRPGVGGWLAAAARRRPRHAEVGGLGPPLRLRTDDLLPLGGRLRLWVSRRSGRGLRFLWKVAQRMPIINAFIY